MANKNTASSFQIVAAQTATTPATAASLTSALRFRVITVSAVVEFPRERARLKMRARRRTPSYRIARMHPS
jgi:hypothetical protein